MSTSMFCLGESFSVWRYVDVGAGRLWELKLGMWN